MPDLLHIRVDGISFFLGVITGVLFWVLFGQFKKNLYPYLLSNIKRQIQAFRDRNFASAEIALRQDALMRAQKSHIAAALFPLDDVLVLPKLVAPPPQVDPSESQPLDLLGTSPFPYLPDWPELPSQFNISFIGLAQALENNVNIAVMGQPGAGKTVCLAQFASQLARKDASLDHLQNLVPIFLHVQDILPQFLLNPDDDPLLLIAHTLSAKFPILVQKRVPSFLKIVFSEGRVIFLLDGLDELPSETYRDAVRFIGKIHTAFPGVRLVTTTSSQCVNGLLQFGFHPIALASWNRSERSQFIRNWSRLWKDQVLPEVAQRAEVEMIDPVFIENWVNPDQIHLTPLEWTTMMWAVYSGEIGVPTAFTALETFVKRHITDAALFEPFQKLALEMVKNCKASFTLDDIDAFFAYKDQVSGQLIATGQPGDLPQVQDPALSSSKERLSFSTQWISNLVQTGFISEHPNHVYQFCHIAVAGFLASGRNAMPEIQSWLSMADYWEMRHLALGLFFGQHPDQFALSPDWIQGKPPMYTRPLSASRWLKYIPPGNSAHSRLMKRLVEGVMDESMLAVPGFSFMAALVFANDPSINSLFLQLMNAPGSKVRSLACLVEGILADKKAFPILINHLSDPEPKVRQNACYAIGLIKSPEANEVLLQCLSAEDEILRQISATSLAGDAQDGHQILQEALKSENLLTRRSAVFGLTLIQENWARLLLEQIAVQDGQWVVRNAASQALDARQMPNPRIPVRLKHPSETPWLFEYASTLGLGIPPGDPAVDILLKALESGTPEQKVAALDHLRLMPEEKVTQAISMAALHGEYPIDQAAQLALWYQTQLNVKTPAVLNRASVSQPN